MMRGNSIRGLGLWLGFWAALISCGNQSLVDCDEGRSTASSCVEKTPDERAMLALNEGDYETAIEILEPLIAANPSEYFRIPRLASAYASLAGLDLFQAVNRMQGEGEGAGGETDALSAFVPKPDAGRRDEYWEQILHMERAKNLLLNDMPAAERQASEANFYGASAELQVFLYRTSHSMMLMNFYVVPVSADSEQLDESVLEELTTEQAVLIIQNLKDSVTDLNDSQESQPLLESAEKLDEAVAKIENEEGDDLGEKLQNYLRKQHTEA